MQNPEVVSDEDLTKPQSLSTLVAQLLEMIDIGSMDAETQLRVNPQHRMEH